MSDEQSEIGPGLLGDLADEEGVRKLIECPICLEIPLPPIYLCTKGHIVCSSCQSRTYVCPLCRERYCNTRSFVAEGIVEKCNLKCRYAEGGCKISMKGAELGEHLSICEFRPVNCRECGDKPINYPDYENHLFKDHNLNGTVGNEAYVAYRINLNFMQRTLVDTCFWPQYYIKAFGKIFLLRLNAYQFSINPWICLFGAQSECENYTALIEYEPSNDEAIVHSWKGPVNHFRAEPTDVIAQGRALSVQMDTILDSGAISTDRAEWIYHIVLYEKPPCTAACQDPSVSLEEGLHDMLTASKDSSSFEQVDTEIANESMALPKEEDSFHQMFMSIPSSEIVPPTSAVRAKTDNSPDTTPRNAPLPTNHTCVSVGVRPVDRRPNCTIHPFNKKNDRSMESAGNQGDIDDTSDFDWDL